LHKDWIIICLSGTTKLWIELSDEIVRVICLWKTCNHNAVYFYIFLFFARGLLCNY